MTTKDGFMKTDRQRKWVSLREITYKYLVKQDNPIIRDLSFEEIEEAKKKAPDTDEQKSKRLLDAVGELDSAYKKVNANLKDIFRIFRIAVFQDSLKDAAEYQFDEDDAEFICEILCRYEEEKIWKKMKKVNNDFYDGFVQIYIQDGSDRILKELEYVMNGFSALFQKREKNQEKQDYIQEQLFITSQFKQIQCMEEMKKTLFSVPALLVEEAYYSHLGELLGKYQEFLEGLKDKLHSLIDEETELWKLCREKSIKEFDEMIYSATDKEMEEVLSMEEHLFDIIRKDNGEDMEKRIRSTWNVEPSIAKLDGSKQDRKRVEEEFKAFCNTIDKLSSEEKLILCRKMGIDKLYNV